MALSNVIKYRNEACQFRGLFQLVIEMEATWNPDSVGSASFRQEDIAVPGALLGDMCLVSYEADLQNINFSAHVKSEGVVSLHLNNNTGGAVDLGSAQIHVVILRPYHRHG